jgi:DoxX-like protein
MEAVMSATLLENASHSAARAAADATSSSNADPSAALRWSGRIATGIVVLFLAFDVGVKLLGSSQAVKGTTDLGFAASQLLPIGLIELACFALYLIPRTAPLGAVLFTGYLGGAIATHLRLGNPLFSHILFPTYVAALLWGGLYARDARVRKLVSTIL